MSDAIIVVTGFSRCGTTLTMRMLHAGGVPVYCENMRSYEHRDTLGLPTETAWLARCGGKAVKVLEPLHYALPSGYPYQILLLSRHFQEQAKSQAKFLHLVGRMPPATPAMIRTLRNSLYADFPKMRRALCALGPTLLLTFEGLLRHPGDAARYMAHFLGRDLDIARMAAQVIPRAPACSPGLLELSSRLRDREEEAPHGTE